MTETGLRPSPAGQDESLVLRAARRSGLIDQVIEQLREQIGSGRWAVGSRIPTETELSATTGTSRNTVREAVQSLVHAGLLERRQGSGTYVIASSELAGAVARRVSEASRRHVLEVRRALEVGAAQLAARRRTDADVEVMRELLRRRAAAERAGDLDASVAADVELHRVISRAAHNPVLTELYENLLDALHENVMRNFVIGGPQGANEHLALVDAIERGDAEAAAAEAACFLDELLDERG